MYGEVLMLKEMIRTVSDAHKNMYTTCEGRDTSQEALCRNNYNTSDTQVIESFRTSQIPKKIEIYSVSDSSLSANTLHSRSNTLQNFETYEQNFDINLSSTYSVDSDDDDDIVGDGHNGTKEEGGCNIYNADDMTHGTKRLHSNDFNTQRDKYILSGSDDNEEGYIRVENGSNGNKLRRIDGSIPDHHAAARGCPVVDIAISATCDRSECNTLIQRCIDLGKHAFII